MNSKLTTVNWPGGRQLTGIEMERVNADHSGIELGIRL